MLRRMLDEVRDFIFPRICVALQTPDSFVAALPAFYFFPPPREELITAVYSLLPTVGTNKMKHAKAGSPGLFLGGGGDTTAKRRRNLVSRRIFIERLWLQLDFFFLNWKDFTCRAACGPGDMERVVH